MVCTNCQSKDVIQVQDQWFCTNCGTVQPTAAEAAEGVATPVADELSEAQVAAADLPAGVTVSPEMAAVIPTITNHAKVEATPGVAEKGAKKRKVGRPKAKRLDVPKPAALSDEPTASPATIAAPKLRVKSAPPVVPTPTPAEVPDIGVAPAKRQMSDIAPRKSAIEPKRKETAEKDKGAKSDVAPKEVQSEAQSQPEPTKRVLHHPPLNYAEIEAESWTGRFHPRYSVLMLFPAALLAVLAGGLAASYLSQTPANLLAITKYAAPAVAGEVLLVLALYYVSHTLAAAALTFGIARDADHRPAPKSRWWGVAVNSFGAHLRLDLMALGVELVGLGLVVALVLTGGVVWPVPESAQIGALLVAFVVMLYLVAGIGLAQNLGRVAVTLGVVPSHRALVLGWSFFRHHFDLVGARLIGLLIDLLMVVPFAALLVVADVYTPGQTTWVLVGLIVVGVVTVGALMGAGGAIWWQAIYRKLVRNERITEVMALLAGRQAERPKRGQLIALSVSMSVLVVLAVVWPWLPLP